ncbi:MAG: hypothetical protein QXX95_00425 [Nitrososphaerales archaeon]
MLDKKLLLLAIIILLFELTLSPFTRHGFDLSIWFKTGALMSNGENIYYPNHHLGYLPLWSYWALLSYSLYKFFSYNYELWLIFIKMPLILAHLTLAILVKVFLDKKHHGVLSKKVFILIVTSPIIIYISAIWGQLNSLSSLLTLLSLILLISKRFNLGFLTLGFSIALKLYPAILLPLLFTYSLKYKGFLSSLKNLFIALIPPFLITFSTLMAYLWDPYPLYLTLYYQVFSLNCDGCVAPNPLMNLWYLLYPFLNLKELAQILWIPAIIIPPTLFFRNLKDDNLIKYSLIIHLSFLSLFSRVSEQLIIEPFILALTLYALKEDKKILTYAIILQLIPIIFSLSNFGLLNFSPLLERLNLWNYGEIDKIYRVNESFLFWVKGSLGLIFSLLCFIGIFQLSREGKMKGIKIFN